MTDRESEPASISKDARFDAAGAIILKHNLLIRMPWYGPVAVFIAESVPHVRQGPADVMAKWMFPGVRDVECVLRHARKRPAGFAEDR